MKTHDGDFILIEYNKLKHLKAYAKKKLIEKLVYFIFENYSKFPSVDDMVLVSKAAVQLFDCLADDKGGIVS